MKITVEYEGQPIVVDISDETLKKIAGSQKKKTGWEKPECSESYWFVDPSKKTDGCRWDGHPVDQTRYDRGNCFTSKELAENIARYQSLDLKIRRRISEICEPVDWKKHSTSKYSISFDHARDSERFIVLSCFTHHYGACWYCDTHEHAQQIIREFYEELVWYFTEFKDRMDG